MKALEQNYRNGELQLVEIPAPRPAAGYVTVRTRASLASVGTERGMIELARKSLIGKAIARPDLVQQVWLKAKQEGPLEAWRQAWGRLNVPVLLGYSSAGEVLEVGPGAVTLRAGDRVACAGAGVAGHVEIALAPATLCTPVPPGVSLEDASFVAIGGIALEAVRVARVALGERVAVIGLGLIGQITVRLLRAAGCHVLGIDRDPVKNELAARSGAESVAGTRDMRATAALALAWSQGAGADAVIVAAATESNEPLELAAEISRERGRIVATGVVGLEVPRRQFYEKELELVVSRAWGPGLYDPEYSRRGLDYPLAYARWTAQRNMAEFLAQLGRGALRVDDLITHRFDLEDAPRAYDMILQGREPCIGVVIQYPSKPAQTPVPPTPVVSVNVGEAVTEPAADPVSQAATRRLPEETDRVVWLRKSARDRPRAAGTTGIGVIGAGQFASGTLFPVISSLKRVSLRGIATRTGLSGRTAGMRQGFDYCTGDYRELLGDPQVDLVLVLTRHDSHASIAAAALAAGKHVFVEKPLAIDAAQLRTVAEAYEAAHRNAGPEAAPVLMVGFNRRYSSHARWMKERFRQVQSPLSIACTVNAGTLDPGSWLANETEGGGRIIGEVCHFIDLAGYLTGSAPVRVYAERVGDRAAPGDDSVVCTLTMADGAVGQISYFAAGDRGHQRERIEVYGGGAVGVIDNFRRVRFVRDGRARSRRSLLSVDRGHRAELATLLSAISGSRAALPSFEDNVSTTLATFALERSLQTGVPEKPGRI